MARQGAVLIKGMLPAAFCANVVTELVEQPVTADGQGLELGASRDKFQTEEQLAGLQTLEDVIGSAIKSNAKERLALTDWSLPVNANIRPYQTEVFRYRPGFEFRRHTDARINQNYATQALVTLQGSGIFRIFGNPMQDHPKFTIPLEIGDVLLLRGDDLAGRQLEHSVSNGTEQQRIVATIRPKSADMLDAELWSMRRGPQDANRLLPSAQRLGDLAMPSPPAGVLPKSG